MYQKSFAWLLVFIKTVLPHTYIHDRKSTIDFRNSEPAAVKLLKTLPIKPKMLHKKVWELRAWELISKQKC